MRNITPRNRVLAGKPDYLGPFGCHTLGPERSKTTVLTLAFMSLEHKRKNDKNSIKYL
jgi:hypothetical protein